MAQAIHHLRRLASKECIAQAVYCSNYFSNYLPPCIEKEAQESMWFPGAGSITAVIATVPPRGGAKEHTSPFKQASSFSSLKLFIELFATIPSKRKSRDKQSLGREEVIHEEIILRYDT